MPIEIKELHIKAVVMSKEAQHQQINSLRHDEVMRLKKEITKEVTEKVIRLLRQKNER